MGILNSAMIGIGAAAQAAQPYIANMQVAEIQKLRDERLSEVARLSQERGFAHADATLDKTQDFQRSLETDVRQPFQSQQQERGFTHAREMQATSLEAAAREHELNREVTREGQNIQRAQVGILAKGAELDREIKTIQLNNARDVEQLKKDLANTTDPKVKQDIVDRIHILTGKDKDKYLPVPLKDENGNVTGYKIFDTGRGQWVDGRAESGKSENDPLNIRGSLPGAKKPVKSAAATGGGIISNAVGIPGAPPLNPNAQAEFDSDVQTMPPKQLVDKYKPVFESLSMPQKLKYYEAEKNLPKRVPGFGG